MTSQLFRLHLTRKSKNYLLDVAERSFPIAQVMAGSDHIDRPGMSPAIILRTPEQIEGAHGHGEIRFLRKAADQSVENSVLYVRIDFYPAGGGENILHRGFRAEDQ